MRLTRQFLSACLFGGLGLALACSPSWSQDLFASPDEIVSDVLEELELDLAANGDAYRADPTALYLLVDRVLADRFDIQYAGRLVLGRWWNASSDEQRQAFVDALYGSLVRRYSQALLGFDSEMIDVLPTRAPLRDDRQVVRTRVRLVEGLSIPVDYSFHLKDEVWKAFDVSIEGRSYVRYFRTVIGNDVAALGLDEVIARLNASGQDDDSDGASQSDDDGE